MFLFRSKQKRSLLRERLKRIIERERQAFKPIVTVIYRQGSSIKRQNINSL